MRCRLLLAATALLVLSPGVAYARAPADLAVTMTASTGSAQVGQDITYTIVATNKGPATTEPAVHDVLPANLALVSITCGVVSPDGPFCEYPPMAKGQSVTMTVVAQVVSASPATAVNTATIFSLDGTPDRKLHNNTAGVSVSIVT